jgi:hypothetical protein
VAERSSERITRSQAIEDARFDRRDGHLVAGRPRVRALAAPLHDHQARPKLEERRGGRPRFAQSRCHLHLVRVPHNDGRPASGLGRQAPRVIAGPPEGWAMVEIMDRDVAPPACVQRGQRGRATRLVGESRAGRPEQRRGGDGLEVEFLAGDVHVGRLRLTVEEEREAIGRVDLAEHERRSKIRIGPHPARIHPESGERFENVLAEAVATDLRDHRRPPAKTCRADGHVRRAAAE